MKNLDSALFGITSMEDNIAGRAAGQAPAPKQDVTDQELDALVARFIIDEDIVTLKQDFIIEDDVTSF